MSKRPPEKALCWKWNCRPKYAESILSAFDPWTNTPLSAEEILEKGYQHIRDSHSATFRKVLRRLVNEQVLVELFDNQYARMLDVQEE